MGIGIQNPVTDPVAVFAILISVIFISPFLFRLIKIPEVAAFIIIGILIGPYGLNILLRDPAIELLGTIGLLYIMFLIGLELDPEKLRISKWQSTLFGIFTFTIPFIFGMFASKLWLGMDLYPSLFISMMLASHTMVAYPVIRKLGVSGDLAVLTAIGGTIITDTLVLALLSVLVKGEPDQTILLQKIWFILIFVVYLLMVLYGYPRISRWFFANVKRDRPVHFLFIIFLVGISSLLATLTGFEAIIGAFVAGMALSRSVPRNSMLMHHVDFVGNILFIPVFLIGIGMLINIRIIFTESTIWVTFLILTGAALASKWLAAFFTQKITGMSTVQRELIFGLTGSRAAAAIAVMLIGFERNIIHENLLDTTVLIILVSCLAGSFLTDRNGKKLAMISKSGEKDKTDDSILVPVSNPSTMAPLVELAIKMQDRIAPGPVYVLNIIHDDISTREDISRIRHMLEAIVSEFNNLSEHVHVITRVDLNISGGIVRTAREYLATEIILGWGGMDKAPMKILGSVFDQLYRGTQILYVCKFRGYPEETETLKILFPKHFEYERSFNQIMKRISRLPVRSGGRIELYSDGDIPPAVRSFLPGRKKVQFVSGPMTQMFNEPLESSLDKTLYILFLPRKQSLSHHPSYNSLVRKQIPALESGNFILIIPGFGQDPD